MRLDGLTLRGRCFLAAGAAAVVCAVVLGQSALVRVGVLLVALPLITAFVVSRGRHAISLVRTVTPPTVVAGQSASVSLTLRNEGRMPAGLLRLEEQLPYALGGRPRFVLDRLEHRRRRVVDYTVRPEARGQYDIGPLTVRVSDPFGLVELIRAFPATTTLTAVPRTVDLPTIDLGSTLSGTGEQRPREFAGGSAEDVTVREYRRGDDLRRVHWRSSARVGELMVRREEQPWQMRATVLLDNRAGAHRGSGLGSSLETAVVVAASVLVHLRRRGYAVRLVTGAEGPVASTLDSLAVVQTSPTTTLETAWVDSAEAQGGLIVAVVGGLAQTDLSPLRRLRHHAGTALAVALDVDAWGASRRPSGSAAPLLLHHGWRAAPMLPSDGVDAVWRHLGMRTRAVRA